MRPRASCVSISTTRSWARGWRISRRDLDVESDQARSQSDAVHHDESPHRRRHTTDPLWGNPFRNFPVQYTRNVRSAIRNLISRKQKSSACTSRDSFGRAIHGRSIRSSIPYSGIARRRIHSGWIGRTASRTGFLPNPKERPDTNILENYPTMTPYVGKRFHSADALAMLLNWREPLPPKGIHVTRDTRELVRGEREYLERDRDSLDQHLEDRHRIETRRLPKQIPLDLEEPATRDQ